MDQLLGMQGAEDRVAALVGGERAQPNGALFELLVAACYGRAGGTVTFVPSHGGAKSHDLDVDMNGKCWAVECKRLEVGEYGNRERSQLDRLWGPSSAYLTRTKQSTLCDVRFAIELQDVPDEYLTKKVRQWQLKPGEPLAWQDDVGAGSVKALDLQPLQHVLETDHVVSGGPKFLALLLGGYVRSSSYRTVFGIYPSEDNFRYIDTCDLAIVLHWDSTSEAAINAKARDILKRLSKAVAQLPNDRPGVVHFGIEAVEGDEVEKRRFKKIIETAGQFDAGTTPLETIYCHYLVPESPPAVLWAFQETNHRIGAANHAPLHGDQLFLAGDPQGGSRPGKHWET
ncbi:MAG: hypothetical protein ABL931_05110, partial [Usitatibacteraceae bacterium]